jgi:hypothetical protein
MMPVPGFDVPGNYYEPDCEEPEDERSKEQSMSKRELIDIAGELRGETDKAYRIYDGKTTEWVPKSQVEQNPDGTFTMPEWLAQDKGFI